MTKESPASLTPEERARELQEEECPGEAHRNRVSMFDQLARIDCRQCLADALRAAEARGRERGIEEAAHRRRVLTVALAALLEYAEWLERMTHRMPSLSVMAARALLSAEPKATPSDYDPITAPIPSGDWMGPHGDLPSNTEPQAPRPSPEEEK